MKDYFSVLKLLIKNSFRGGASQKKNSRTATIAVLAVSYVILMFFAVTGIVGIAPAITGAEMESQVLTLVFSVCILVVLFFGIRSVLAVLYFSRDTEFFASLPVKPSAVYFAKMTFVYLGMLLIEAALMIPILLTLGITMHMTVVYYVVALTAVLALPVYPLMLASVIAMPLMFLASKFKNRGAVSSVVMIVLFALVFALYYYFMFSLSFTGGEETADIRAALLQMKPSLDTLSAVLLPIASIARLATLAPTFGLNAGASAAVNVGIYLASVAILLLIAFAVSTFAYKKGALAISEGGGKVKEREFRSLSASKALLKKEWRQLIRTPIFAFNSLMVVAFTPLLLFVMNFATRSSAPEGEAMIGAVFGVMNFFMAVMMTGMNFGASTSITREGENFAFGKSLAVPYARQLAAKRKLYLIIGYVSMALGIAVSAILTKDVIGALLQVAFFAFYVHGYVGFAIYYDLCSPNLKWTTPQEAMKNNFRSMVPFLINLGVGVVLMIPLMIAAVLGVTFGGLWTALRYVVWAILIAAAFVFALLMDRKLKKDADRLYSRIEC